MATCASQLMLPLSIYKKEILIKTSLMMKS